MMNARFRKTDGAGQGSRTYCRELSFLADRVLVPADLETMETCRVAARHGQATSILLFSLGFSIFHIKLTAVKTDMILLTIQQMPRRRSSAGTFALLARPYKTNCNPRDTKYCHDCCIVSVRQSLYVAFAL